MKITEENVRYIADLANLALSGEEIGKMAFELDEILTHIDKLNALDTEGVEPMAQLLFEDGSAPALRDDEPREPIGPERALANAPVAGSGCFKVPKVIER